MDTITRRAMISSVAASSVTAATLTPFAFAAPRLRRRVSIANRAAAKPHMDALAQALHIMRGTANLGGLDPVRAQIAREIIQTGGENSSHPFSLGAQSDVHQRYFSGIHNSWNFFPWHRAQLFFFESVVAYLSGYRDFAMPYWDPTDPRTKVLPPDLFVRPFTCPRVEGTNRRDIYQTRLDRYRDPPARMNDPRFLSFGGGQPGQRNHLGQILLVPGSIERGTHNIVHRIVGEIGPGRNLTMATLRSPSDPLFWFHHCNIDRMWASWQVMHRHTNYDGAYPRHWTTQNFNGQYPAPAGLAMLPNTRSLHPSRVVLSDLCVTQDFGYEYDQLFLDIGGVFDEDAPPPEPFAQPEGYTLVDREFVPVDVQARNTTRYGQPVQFRVPMPVRFGSLGETGWRSLDRATLRVRASGAGTDQYLLQVSLLIDGQEATPSNLVETIVPRGIVHEGHAHDAYAFDIDATEALRRALTSGNQAPVTVLIRALPASGGIAMHDTVETGVSFELEARRFNKAA